MIISNIIINRINNIEPTNPNMFVYTVNIKSVYGSGKYKYFWVELPKPTPVSPPLFIAI